MLIAQIPHKTAFALGSQWEEKLDKLNEFDMPNVKKMQMLANTTIFQVFALGPVLPPTQVFPVAALDLRWPCQFHIVCVSFLPALLPNKCVFW